MHFSPTGCRCRSFQSVVTEWGEHTRRFTTLREQVGLENFDNVHTDLFIAVKCLQGLPPFDYNQNKNSLA